MSLETSAVIAVMQALKKLTADPIRCFTFYDITRTARNFTDEEVGHSQVKELVTAFLEEGFMANYSLSPHSFTQDGKSRQAQLFHTSVGSPQDYQPDATLAVTNAN